MKIIGHSTYLKEQSLLYPHLDYITSLTCNLCSVLLQMSAGAFCYLVFFGVSMGVAAYVYYFIPETRNKTFVEISQMFCSKDNAMEIHALGVSAHSSKMNGYGTLEEDLEK